MQDERTALPSLHRSIDTIIIHQWVMMHLDNLENTRYVQLEKGVYSEQGLGCVSTRLCISFSFCVSQQRGTATQATGVRRSYRRLAGAIPLVVGDTPHGWAAPRAAAQRRGQVALPMDTFWDTLPTGTPGPGGCDTAFPSTCRSGLGGT